MTDFERLVKQLGGNTELKPGDVGISNVQARNTQAAATASKPAAVKPASTGKTNWVKLLGGTLLKGADEAVSGITSTVNNVIGEPAQEAWYMTGLNNVFGDTNPITKINDIAQKSKAQNQQYFGENASKSKVARLMDEYGTATAAAIPMAAVALMTAGSSLGAQATTAGLEATSAAAQAPGLATTISTGLRTMAKDPNYWTAYLQTAGNSYDTAKKDGASDLEASAYGMVNGLMNALIEVGGGGIQELPKALRNKSASGVREWVKTMFDEGKENVVQGVIERGLQNVAYGKGNPIASTTNGNAIFNPKTAGNEFASGAVVGGLLGGGQALITKGINARTNVPQTAQADTNVPDTKAQEAKAVIQSLAGTRSKSSQNAVSPQTQNVTPEPQNAPTVERGAAGEIVRPIQPAVNAVESGMGAADKGFATTPYTEWQNATNEGEFHPISDTAAQNVVEKQSRAPMEIPKQDTQGGLTSKQVSTIVNSGITPNDFASSLANDAATGKFSRMAYSDADAVHKAEQTILGKSWDEAYTEYKDAVKDGKVSKDITASGIVLYNNAVTSGDYAKAMDIASTMIGNSTNVGQAMQAMNLLNKLSPEGKLYMAQKAVDDINERVKERLGDKFTEITVDPDLMKAYKEALDSGDEDASQKAWTDIKQNVADQIPADWKDKLKAWLYLAMLGNPHTHIKNIEGNAGFMPVRMMKNLVGAGIERMTLGKVGEGSGRTKAVLNLASAEDRQLLQAGWSEYTDVVDLIQSGGKFNDNNSEIEDMRTILKPKALEAVRKFNNKALDTEDAKFSRPAYAGSLAGYLKANGISAKDYMEGNISAEVKTAAREYAVKEAQKATYRDTNDFSQYVSQLGKSRNSKSITGKVVNVGIQGVLPFKKTPANMLVRGFEYSPLELLKVLAFDIRHVKSGDMAATDMIDHISSGLTGMGLLGLGIYLASQGLLSGGSSGDDKQDSFNKLQGQQGYALSIGDKNYTLDSLAPEILPVFVGVELHNRWVDSGKNPASIWDSLTRIASPVLDMSMLSGLNDIIDNVSYKDKSGKLWAVAASSAASLLSQFIPTLGGQIERTTEDTRQTTFIDRNSPITSDTQYAIGKAANKIPGVDYNQINYIDAWGRKTDTGSTAGKIANNFFNPAYVSKNNTTALDTELQRLYDAGQTNVLPQRAETSTKVNDEYLTGDEYEKYQTTKGQTSYDILSKAVSTFAYKDMTDEQKAKAVSGAYEYSTYKANRQIASERGESLKKSEWDKYADAEKNGVDFWTMWKIKHPEDKNGNGKADQKEERAVINALAGVTPQQKTYLRKSIKPKGEG